MVKRQNPDVIVVGGGIFGLSAAYHCALAGLSVHLFEADHIGAGASGGIVGALSPHTPDSWNVKKQFQLEALVKAPKFWTDVDARSGLSSGYAPIGRVCPVLSERTREMAVQRIEDARLRWGDAFTWEVADGDPRIISDATPFGVTYDTLTARLNPAKACMSLKAALMNMGVIIEEGAPVETVANGVVKGPWGELSADRIILAQGVNLFEMLAQKFERSAGDGIKGQAALLDVDLRGSPVMFVDGIFVVPHEDGTTAVGSTSEREYIDAFSIDGQLDELLEHAASLIPCLKDVRVRSRWAGIRPRAARRNPLLGPIPNDRTLLLAGGGFKIGLGIAHHVGEMLADVIIGKPVDIPINFQLPWQLKLNEYEVAFT